MAHDDQGNDQASLAFESLRAELTLLRAAIATLTAEAKVKPVDYAPTLGAMQQALDSIGGQLATIKKSPALMRTPEQQGEAICKAGEVLIREAAQKFQAAVNTIERERAQLSQIIGQALDQDRQLRLLALAAAVVFAVGLVLSPLFAGLLPFGLNTRVAALVMREDRWSAGDELMRAGDPKRWARQGDDLRLVDANREAIDACRTASPRAGKPEHCTFVLASPEAAEGQRAPTK